MSVPIGIMHEEAVCRSTACGHCTRALGCSSTNLASILPSLVRTVFHESHAVLIESTMSLERFSRFNDLPSELRLLIWGARLPANDPPALHIATSPFAISSSSRKKSTDGPVADELNESDRRLVEVAFPQSCRTLLHVAREPRSAVLAWATNHGYELVFREQTGGHVFAREVDADKDIVYISAFNTTGWFDGGRGPIPSWFQSPDPSIEKNMVMRAFCAEVQHVAFQANVIDMFLTPEVLSSLILMPKLKALTVIWEKWPQMYPRTWSDEACDYESDLSHIKVMPRLETAVVDGPEAYMTHEISTSELIWGKDGEGAQIPLQQVMVDAQRIGMFRAPYGMRRLPGHIWDYDLGQLTLEFIHGRVVWKSGEE